MKFKLIIDKSAEEVVVVTAHERSALTDKLEALVSASEESDRITVKSQTTLKQLSFDEIECITVIDGKTSVIDVNGDRFEAKQRLYELEEILPSSFIRINKSAIANKKRLEKFTAGYSGSVNAVFKCGYTDYVSRRCFAKIRKELA